MSDTSESDGPRAPEEAAGPSRAETEPLGSLVEDVGALIEDGRTYVEAEYAYQRARAAYSARESGTGVAFAMAALAFLHLAAIGGVIGLIMALTPKFGALAATGIVVGSLIILTLLFALFAWGRFKRVGKAFKKPTS